MRIYIEQYMLSAALFSYWSISSAYRFLRRKGEPWRYLTVFAIVCLAALFCPFIRHTSVKWGLFAAVFVVSVPILYAGKGALVRGAVALAAAILLYGGIVAGVGFVWHGSLYAAFTKPLSVWLWLLLGAGYALYRLWAYACVVHHRNRHTADGLRTYSVTIDGKTVTGIGFSDTGNRLYDVKSGLPVVLISLAKIAAMLDDADLPKLLKGQVREVFPRARRISCRSLAGQSSMWVLPPDNFEVYSRTGEHIVYEVMVGLSFAPTVRGETYDAILHPAISEVD